MQTIEDLPFIVGATGFSRGVWHFVTFLFCLSAQCTKNAQSQVQNKFWHFGVQASLIIDTNSVQEYFFSEINGYEASASIGDNNGNALLYVADSLVYNSNDQIITNGSGLKGHRSSTQGSLFVPMPGNSSEYFLFQHGDLFDPNLYFSRISTNGNAQVHTKNVQLDFPVTEKLTATLHDNQQDYWIVAHRMASNVFVAYHLSNNGVDTIPVESHAGTAVLWSSQQAAGYMRFNVEGNKIAYAIRGLDLLELCFFNDQTGVVSNCMTLDTVPRPYGVEFSADGSKLYSSVDGYTVGDSTFIYQYDLMAGGISDIRASRYPVARGILQSSFENSFKSLALAPDGKIYVSKPLTNWLGVINHPDSTGTACDYDGQGFEMTFGQCSLGLPNQIKKYADVVNAVIEEDPIPEFAIYPNPAWEGFYVQLPSALYKKYLNFELFDLTGRVVNMGELTNKERYSISREDLEAGLYQGVVRDEQKVVGVFRVLFE